MKPPVATDREQPAPTEPEDAPTAAASGVFITAGDAPQMLPGVPPAARGETDRLHASARARLAARDYPAAIEGFVGVVALHPRVAAAHYNLGIAYQLAERHAEAEAQYRGALALDRRFVPAWLRLGELLRGRNSAEALACYRQIVAIEPGHASALNNAGLLLKKLGRFADAETALAHAAAAAPDNPTIRFNQLIARRDDASLGQALDLCRRMVVGRVDNVELITNFAVLLHLTGRYDEARGWFERAIAIDPGSREARFNFAMLLLLQGDFARGLEEYERRWREPVMRKLDHAQPRWEGENFSGRTLLLRFERGFGDTIQMLRYVPAVAARGGRIVLEIERPLVRLAASLPGDIVIKPAGTRLPAFDLWCPLMGLPRVLATRLDSIPAPIPYLGVRRAIVERWKTRLVVLPGPKVGLAWAGRSDHVNDRRRSIRLETLTPLVEVPGISWVSLQEGARAADLVALPAAVTDVSAELMDFAETAGAIANLDLVVTIDSAVAHLAGAMGKPVWTLLPFSPDWRWQLARADSPWYPSMRLYRQPAAGDWDGVVREVRDAMTRLVASPRALTRDSIP